jgi:hypothetical protein
MRWVRLTEVSLNVKTEALHSQYDTLQFHFLLDQRAS